MVSSSSLVDWSSSLVVHYPRSTGEFQAWFRADEDCPDYLEWLRWPGGFTCPSCGHAGVPIPATFLVVLHVPAAGGKVLPRILGRAGLLPASAAADGEVPLRSHVYVAPPDCHLSRPRKASTPPAEAATTHDIPAPGRCHARSRLWLPRHLNYARTPAARRAGSGISRPQRYGLRGPAGGARLPSRGVVVRCPG
jgi:CheB methylesterase/Transposase zinc-ribbon domain